MKFDTKTGQWVEGYQKAFCNFGGSEPAGQTTVTQNRDPWSGAQPHLTAGFEEAALQKDIPREYYEGSTVVPFSGQTEAALQTTEDRAVGGNPLLGQAQGEASKVLGGDYLNTENPAFQAMGDRIHNQVRPRIDSQFAGVGRYGGAGHEEQMGRTMADAMAPLAFQNYQSERGNMQNMAEQAPGLAREDYFDIGQLAGVGGEREGQAGRQLSENVDRWNFDQLEPQERLARYMALVSGGSTGLGSSSTSKPYFTDPLGSALGTASSLAGIYGNLFG